MYRRPFLRRRRAGVFFRIILALSAVLAALAFMERSVVPALVSLAEAEASAFANDLLVRTVYEEIVPLMEGVQLIEFVMSSGGEVVFAKVNSAYLNQLESRALKALQDGLRNIGEFRVRVPLGQLLGFRILAAWGPRFTVKLIPAGVVGVKVTDSFEVAGINQTKYTVFLTARITIRVVVPLVFSSTVVNGEVPIATVLIPGKVPDAYLHMPSRLTIEPESSTTGTPH